MLLAMAGFAVEDTLLKILARDLPISELLILLGLGGFLLFSAVVIIRRDPIFSPQMRNKPFAIRFVADIFAPLFFLSSTAGGWQPVRDHVDLRHDPLPGARVERLLRDGRYRRIGPGYGQVNRGIGRPLQLQCHCGGDTGRRPAGNRNPLGRWLGA